MNIYMAAPHIAPVKELTTGSGCPGGGAICVLSSRPLGRPGPHVSPWGLMNPIAIPDSKKPVHYGTRPYINTHHGQVGARLRKSLF